MATSPSPGPHVVRFGVYEADLRAGELRNQGLRIRLPEQPFQLLAILLEHPGEVVTREDLQKRLWPEGTFVDFEQGLNAAVKRLREVLGDSAETPRYIETLPRRGYRFIARMNASPRQIESLVVLPLENLSHDPEQDYFAEGMTEALITTLAKIGALRIVSRTSAMRYKGVQRPLREIAQELRVDGIIEGAVLRSGDRVRISAQLLDAHTDTHLWAESYDRDLRDVLALQSEVAQAIAREIRVKLTPVDQARFAEVRPVEPEAYEAYLKGRYHLNRRSTQAFPKAIQCFQHAMAKDSTYAAAYAGLADCLSVLGWWNFVSPDEGCGMAKRLALQALERDPSLAEAHASLAWATMLYDYDFVTAEREFERSLGLNARYAPAHYWFGLCLAWMGRYEEAYTELKRALRLDPQPILGQIMGFVLYFARRFEEAIQQFESVLEMDSSLAQPHWGLCAVYAQKSLYERAIAAGQKAVELSEGGTLFVAILGEAYAIAGRRDEAQKILDQLQDSSKQRYVSPYLVGRIYADLGEKEEAFHWLETAYQERAAQMVCLKTDPRFDNLRPDPRFQDLLSRMNYPT
jgi:adenylate cyclase